MLSYCLKCTGNTESRNPKVVKTKTGRIMLLSNRAVHDCKKLTFIKNQEDSILLSIFRTKVGFGKIPIIGPILF